MSLRGRNSGMEMAGIARYVGRAGFSMSMTFLLLALGVLFFFEVGMAERVVLLITVWINAAIALGSALLIRMMYKSDMEFKRRQKQERHQQGKKTLEEWMDGGTV